MKFRALSLSLMLSSAFAAPIDSVTLSDLSSGPQVRKLADSGNNQSQPNVESLLANARVNHALIMLSLRSKDDILKAKPIVAQALSEGLDLLLEGEPEWLAQLKPGQQTAWSYGNLLFISNRSESRGLFIVKAALDMPTVELKNYIIKIRNTLQSEQNKATFQPSNYQDFPVGENSHSQQSWDINLPSLAAQTPSEVCLAIRNALFNKISDKTVSRQNIHAAVRRVCQYGTIADVTATAADATVPGWPYSHDALLNLRQEWLYLVSNDPYQPSESRAYLWIKTLGEGGGSGFTRVLDKDGAWFGGSDWSVRNIMHPFIHSGWGPINNSELAWINGKPSGVFSCEENPDISADIAGEKVHCPVRPRLLNVQPQNTFDDQATIMLAQGWTIGGTLTAGIVGGKPMASLALNSSYTQTRTSSIPMKLLHVRSNADTTYYRSTEWLPNWPAMYAWLKPQSGSLITMGTATPLASTLNPQYSAVWQLPLEANANRTLQYGSQYEARWESCQWSHMGSNDCPKDNHGFPIESRMRWYDKADLLLTM